MINVARPKRVFRSNPVLASAAPTIV